VTARPIDGFAWHCAFFSHRVYREAPAARANLSDLAQMVCTHRGQQGPNEAAEKCWLNGCLRWARDRT
jgi:hypothetical protein